MNEINKLKSKIKEIETKNQVLETFFNISKIMKGCTTKKEIVDLTKLIFESGRFYYTKFAIGFFSGNDFNFLYYNCFTKKTANNIESKNNMIITSLRNGLTFNTKNLKNKKNILKLFSTQNRKQIFGLQVMPLIVMNKSIGGLFITQYKNDRPFNVESNYYFSLLTHLIGLHYWITNLVEEKQVNDLHSKDTFLKLIEKELNRAEAMMISFSVIVIEFTNILQIPNYSLQKEKKLFAKILNNLYKEIRAVDEVILFTDRKIGIVLPVTAKAGLLNLVKRIKDILVNTIKNKMLEFHFNSISYPDDVNSLTEIILKLNI